MAVAPRLGGQGATAKLEPEAFPRGREGRGSARGFTRDRMNSEDQYWSELIVSPPWTEPKAW